jgi:biopolymer transport protein ExbD
MKIKSHRESFASLESIAITDIVLNMFIFFFTAFSLVYTFNPSRESRIMVKLPQADFKTPVEQSDPLVISVRGRNEIFLDNKPRTLKDLRVELQSLMAKNRERPVIVRADKKVVFDDVVQVLDVTKNAGVERLGIAIEEKSSRPLSSP